MPSVKYRQLSRSSSHRQALLRNLVTSLIEHETISTTFAKAKEAQRRAEKLITLGKRNTNLARHLAQSHLYEPEKHLPKLFGVLRERYANRPGGYTRVMRQEPGEDQAESAILCLVDGPKDIRFHMTARAVVRERANDLPPRQLTAVHVRKVTRFREGGLDELEREVKRLEALQDKEGKPSDDKKEKDQEEEDEDEDEDEWEDIEEKADARFQRLPQPSRGKNNGERSPRLVSRSGGSRKVRRAATKERARRSPAQ